MNPQSLLYMPADLLAAPGARPAERPRAERGEGLAMLWVTLAIAALGLLAYAVGA